MSSTRKPSPHEKIEQSGQRQPDKGSPELNKAEYSETETDPSIEADFDDLLQEEWNELLTSYSAEKEKECSATHQEPRTPAPYQNRGVSPR
ncbi:hypothetical protein NDU88_010918 [Pleurodeles waltl]|uniref:Uncharacterized protein n=1 Tax=Pleurodeles waltl TaxID=8319 RepID=A0AAV7QVQ4_PLEWA|nr:hypothetical protein NDU88_010918 [Pleurodeles waltl]